MWKKRQAGRMFDSGGEGRCAGAEEDATQSEMVPSDPSEQPALHPACTDWTWRSMPPGGRLVAPRRRFSPGVALRTPLARRTLQSPAPAGSIRALSPRSGLSLAYTEVRLAADPAVGSKLLTCYFDSIPRLSPARSVLCSLPRVRSHAAGKINAQTRCRFPTRNPRTERFSAAPLRGFYPPRDQRARLTLSPRGSP